MSQFADWWGDNGSSIVTLQKAHRLWSFIFRTFGILWVDGRFSLWLIELVGEELI